MHRHHARRWARTAQSSTFESGQNDRTQGTTPVQQLLRTVVAACFSAIVLAAIPQTAVAQPAAPNTTGPSAASPQRSVPTLSATQSLDEQVQEIKSDVLAIAAELSNLEEKLLYPSDTQIAIFVSLEKGQSVDVDSAQISIDGELVARHIYSFKEVAALEKGGVQRIYTGNIPTGAHRLEVSVSGKRGSGKDFEVLEEFAFEKNVDPKLVGITLTNGSVAGTSIEIEDW